MRVLVTNSRCAQAYAVVRALRPHAEAIVATMSGPRPLGIWPTCNAAYSRLVDRSYRVPDPEADWHEGRIQPYNTPREEAFVAAALDICEREGIDTVFPSNDPWIYVFAKNKERFERRGIVIPVPDYETVIKPLDKYRTVQCAQEVGFPHPRTHLPDGDEDTVRIAAEFGPPWVLKPRFTTGGRGMAVVDGTSELLEKVRDIRRHHGTPMIQEYVPGKDKQNFYLVLDRNGTARSIMTPRVVRTYGRVLRCSSAATESAPPHAMTDQATSLARHMGWWGGVTIQTKIDSRDGMPKLMEVNPRLGTHLWYRTELGINEPLMCVQIARGEPVEPVDYPIGCLLVQPIEDSAEFVVELLDMLAYHVRTKVLRRRPIDASNPPGGLVERLRAYRASYSRARQRRFSPYFRYALEDPLPALIWTSKVLASRARMAAGGIGQ